MSLQITLGQPHIVLMTTTLAQPDRASEALVQVHSHAHAHAGQHTNTHSTIFSMPAHLDPCPTRSLTHSFYCVLEIIGIMKSIRDEIEAKAGHYSLTRSLTLSLTHPHGQVRGVWCVCVCVQALRAWCSLRSHDGG